MTLKKKGDATARWVANDTVSRGDVVTIVADYPNRVDPAEDRTDVYTGEVTKARHRPVSGNRVVVLKIWTDDGKEVSVLSCGTVQTPHGEGDLDRVTS